VNWERCELEDDGRYSDLEMSVCLSVCLLVIVAETARGWLNDDAPLYSGVKCSLVLPPSSHLLTIFRIYLHSLALIIDYTISLCRLSVLRMSVDKTSRGGGRGVGNALNKTDEGCRSCDVIDGSRWLLTVCEAQRWVWGDPVSHSVLCHSRVAVVWSLFRLHRSLKTMISIKTTKMRGFLAKII